MAVETELALTVGFDRWLDGYELVPIIVRPKTRRISAVELEGASDRGAGNCPDSNYWNLVIFALL